MDRWTLDNQMASISTCHPFLHCLAIFLNHVKHCVNCASQTCSDVEGRVTVQNCTSSTDRKCGCKDGYHASASRDACIQHTTCPLGFGVLHTGVILYLNVKQNVNLGLFSSFNQPVKTVIFNIIT